VRGPVLAPVLAGLRHAAAGVPVLTSSPVLLAVLGIDLAAMVLGLPLALLPELAARSFGDPVGGGPALGLLLAAYPAGVVAAAWLPRLAAPPRTPLTGSALLWGGTVILTGLAPSLAVAVAAFAAGGAAGCVLSASRSAITQAATDDALRGRVQGLLTAVLTGGPQLGILLHGAAGAVWGARPVIVAGGVLTIAAVTALAIAVPALRHAGPAPAPAPQDQAGAC
jgi:MFS family permease